MTVFLLSGGEMWVLDLVQVLELLAVLGFSIRQETVTILKGSRKPKDNLTVKDRMALQALKANETLKVLPADKGNMTAVLDIAYYNWKITALLEDHANGKLKKNPTESWNAKLCFY
jgi:hypothetical protein